MITRFEIIQPPAQLKGYVERMFLIESSGRMPSDDLKLIVPNACIKLVIPFKNGLIGKSAAWNHTTKENKISIIGISDISATVDYSSDGPAGNITVEFSPLGAYRFFNFRWADIKNQIHNYSDISQKMAGDLEEQLVNAGNTSQKITIVQQFLIRRLLQAQTDPVFDFCVRAIVQSRGKVSIRQLEKYSGFSARWLNMKFNDKLGLSPKNLASLIRFQQYYKSLVTNTEKFFLQKQFYDYYHDQAHFIRDFKRFTGLPPLFLSQSSNQYDSVFYRD